MTCRLERKSRHSSSLPPLLSGLFVSSITCETAQGSSMRYSSLMVILAPWRPRLYASMFYLEFYDPSISVSPTLQISTGLRYVAERVPPNQAYLRTMSLVATCSGVRVLEKMPRTLHQSLGWDNHLREGQHLLSGWVARPLWMHRCLLFCTRVVLDLQDHGLPPDPVCASKPIPCSSDTRGGVSIQATSNRTVDSKRALVVTKNTCPFLPRSDSRTSPRPIQHAQICNRLFRLCYLQVGDSSNETAVSIDVGTESVTEDVVPRSISG